MLIKTCGCGLITPERTLEPFRAGICLLAEGGVIESGFHGGGWKFLNSGSRQGFTRRKKRLPELIGTVTALVPFTVVMAREELNQLVGLRSGLS